MLADSGTENNSGSWPRNTEHAVVPRGKCCSVSFYVHELNTTRILSAARTRFLVRFFAPVYSCYRGKARNANSVWRHSTLLEDMTQLKNNLLFFIVDAKWDNDGIVVSVKPNQKTIQTRIPWSELADYDLLIVNTNFCCRILVRNFITYNTLLSVFSV